MSVVASEGAAQVTVQAVAPVVALVVAWKEEVTPVEVVAVEEANRWQWKEAEEVAIKEVEVAVAGSGGGGEVTLQVAIKEAALEQVAGMAEKGVTPVAVGAIQVMNYIDILANATHFDLDAAILFSDILTIPDSADGIWVTMRRKGLFSVLVRTAADIAKLAVPDMDGELRYVMDAVRLIRSELHGRVPLIGFSGSPWTLACYMVEGLESQTSMPRSWR
ncbi:MAG: hypothetical protein WDW38_001172 [Sanguina aurantia]